MRGSEGWGPVCVLLAACGRWQHHHHNNVWSPSGSQKRGILFPPGYNGDLVGERIAAGIPLRFSNCLLLLGYLIIMTFHRAISPCLIKHIHAHTRTHTLNACHKLILFNFFSRTSKWQAVGKASPSSTVCSNRRQISPVYGDEECLKLITAAMSNLGDHSTQ